VRQPEAFAQVLLAQDVVAAIEGLVSQPLVLKSQLQQRVHLELQQVGVEVLQEVHINTRLHHNGQSFSIRVVFCEQKHVLN